MSGERERERGADPDRSVFAPGSPVVIRYNPHRLGVEGIVGTVVRFEPGTGFMGCDLVYVAYRDPLDGTEHELPFATYNLDQGDRASLLAQAARHEEQAATLRRMADEVTTANAGPVPVPQGVLDGIEAVRLSGATNMLDRSQVAELAETMGFEQAAAWVTANRDLYARGIFHGFVAPDQRP